VQLASGPARAAAKLLLVVHGFTGKKTIYFVDKLLCAQNQFGKHHPVLPPLVLINLLFTHIIFYK